MFYKTENDLNCTEMHGIIILRNKKIFDQIPRKFKISNL